MTPVASRLCMHCGTYPCHVEGNKVHDFCGKGCAIMAGTLPKLVPKNHVEVDLCIICHRRPKYRTRERRHEYCGRTCAMKGRNGAQSEGNFEPAEDNQQPKILEIPRNDPRFQSVVTQFNASWRHDNNIPDVVNIYEVTSTPSAVEAYNAYRTLLETRSRFASKSGNRMTEGNEKRRWHGTRRTCLLGDPGHTRMCSNVYCSLCNIITYSYDMKHVGKAHKWCRFGRGIYVSSTSSKSNDYIKNDGEAVDSPFKAILLNKVLVGKGFKVKTNQESLSGPPKGYDSVLGEVGSDLNYDETIVYRSDAVIPSYLVMYRF